MQLIPASKPATSQTPEILQETITLDVSGMKCAGCVKAVETELTQQSGVVSAQVNLVTEVAVVRCEPASTTPEHLAQLLTEAGFPTQPRYPEGLTPDGTSSLPAINLAERRRLESQEQLWRLATATLLLALSALGHLQHLAGITIPGLSNIWFHCILATLALFGPGRSMAIEGWRGLRRNAPNMNTLVSLGTFTAYSTSLVALLFPNLGWECFFDEPVMLVGFILLGRTLEQQARNRAAGAFQALLDLQPKIARLIKQNSQVGSDSQVAPSTQAASFVEIPVDRVRVGEWLQVLPGDKIPVDGEVMAGSTTVNEAMLTGEPIPVLKQPGDLVAAGTINQSGVIALRATRTGQDTTLAQIISLVETAQTRKAPIQRLADTVAGYFTYGVLTIASLTFLFWYFIGTQLWPTVLMAENHWVIGGDHGMTQHLLHSQMMMPMSPLLLSLKLAIAVLVVACPCALGLATPTAILVGSGIGAERGILIRGGDILEQVHRLDTIVLDKTGTLTTGTPVVTDCLPLIDNLSPSLLLQIAASVESGTRHPLAIAIQQEAQRQKLLLLPTQDFITEAGYGVTARVSLPPEVTQAAQVILGTEEWLARHGVTLEPAAQLRANPLIQEGKTIIYMAMARADQIYVLAGILAVADELRPDAVETVTTLQDLGLQVLVLTGSQPEATIAIAEPLHLATSNILSGVKPDGKAAIIAQLQNQGHQVAMVGDGINDAPALAQANVGIALQSGTDVAVEAAGIILMRDRLTDVVESIRLSCATFNKIRQNLFWAFAYNTLGLPLAAGALLPTFGILLSPAAAGAMMAFSSVSVVTNSLLLYLTFSASNSSDSSGHSV